MLQDTPQDNLAIVNSGLSATLTRLRSESDEMEKLLKQKDCLISEALDGLTSQKPKTSTAFGSDFVVAATIPKSAFSHRPIRDSAGGCLKATDPRLFMIRNRLLIAVRLTNQSSSVATEIAAGVATGDMPCTSWSQTFDLFARNLDSLCSQKEALCVVAFDGRPSTCCQLDIVVSWAWVTTADDPLRPLALHQSSTVVTIPYDPLNTTAESITGVEHILSRSTTGDRESQLVRLACLMTCQLRYSVELVRSNSANTVVESVATKLGMKTTSSKLWLAENGGCYFSGSADFDGCWILLSVFDHGTLAVNMYTWTKSEMDIMTTLLMDALAKHDVRQRDGLESHNKQKSLRRLEAVLNNSNDNEQQDTSVFYRRTLVETLTTLATLY